MMVGIDGLVVTRGYAQQDVDRVEREYNFLIESGRLIVVLEDEQDSMLKVRQPHFHLAI